MDCLKLDILSGGEQQRESGARLLADKLPAGSGALGWRQHGARRPATAVPGDVNYTSSTLINKVLLVRPAAIGGKGHPVDPLHPFLGDQGILAFHIADNNA